MHVQAPVYNVLRMPRPLLPAQAQVQLELCRQLQAGASAAVCAPSWLQVLTMWSRGTDMAQAETPAFALHLWTRVQPLVCPSPSPSYLPPLHVRLLLLHTGSLTPSGTSPGHKQLTEISRTQSAQSPSTASVLRLRSDHA